MARIGCRLIQPSSGVGQASSAVVVHIAREHDILVAVEIGDSISQQRERGIARALQSLIEFFFAR
jgi:hypothetical protein